MVSLAPVHRRRMLNAISRRAQREPLSIRFSVTFAITSIITTILVWPAMSIYLSIGALTFSFLVAVLGVLASRELADEETKVTIDGSEVWRDFVEHALEVDRWDSRVSGELFLIMFRARNEAAHKTDAGDERESLSMTRGEEK